MRVASVFLAGIAAGVGVGFLAWSRDVVEPRAASHAASSAPRVAAGRAAEGLVPRVPDGAEEPAKDGSGQPVPAAATSSARGVSTAAASGRGTVRIEWLATTAPEVEIVGGQEIDGGPEAREVAFGDSRSAEVELAAGRYAVRYECGPSGRSRYREFLVEPNARIVLRLDEASPCTDVPPPRPGLAVLYVRALDARARPEPDLTISVSGWVFDRVQESEEDTDEEGVAVFELVPGAYEVRAGARVVPVVLAERASQVVEIRPDAEGSLRLRNSICGMPLVRRAGSEEWLAECRFLAAGEYEVAFVGFGGQSPRPIGRAFVRARDETEFHLDLPAGSLRVTLLEARRERVTGHVELDPSPPTASGEPFRAPLQLHLRGDGRFVLWTDIPHLEPGTYRVRAHLAGGKHPLEAKVAVGSATTELAIAVPPE